MIHTRQQHNGRFATLVFVVSFLLFIGTGCTIRQSTDTTNQSQESAPKSIVQELQSEGVAQHALLHVLSDAIVITDPANEDLLRIQAHEPQEAIWLSNSAGVLWAEQAEEGSGYSIQRYAFDEQTTEHLYWSRSLMHTMRTSSDGTMLSFIENDDLFVLSLEDKTVHRIADNVTYFEWAQDHSVLVFNTDQKTIYMEIDSDGEIVSVIEISPDMPLDAIAVLDSKTLLGIQDEENEEGETVSQLVMIDLRSVSFEPLAEWPFPPSGPTTLFLSPDQDYAIVSQQEANEQFLRLLDMQTYEVSPLGVDETFIAWQDKNTIIVGTENKDNQQHLNLFERRVTTGKQTPSIEDVFKPVLIPQS